MSEHQNPQLRSWSDAPLSAYAAPEPTAFVDGPFGSDLKVSDYTESGVRIEALPHTITDNPQPIRLNDGTYLMVYQNHDIQYEGSLPWEHTEIHLATSTDGYTWTTDPTVIVYGGTSCVVETADGTLYLYYVNR